MSKAIILESVQAYCDDHDSETNADLYCSIRDVISASMKRDEVVCKQCGARYMRLPRDPETGIARLIPSCLCGKDGEVVRTVGKCSML